ncbi:amidohydrolase family protein [Paenibacillus sp. y28]|uniref:amidohydrolase family protein n=1 Tax=Paenibacillus sp. y28 TaxID=3129110 RepID=UPI003017C205
MKRTNSLHLVNVRLPLKDETKLYELKAEEGVWLSIAEQTGTMEFHPAGLVPLSSVAPGGSPSQMIDAQGRILLPGFVDMHMHLDKATSLRTVGNVTGTLGEAIQNYSAHVAGFSKDEIKRRIISTALQALSHGTTHIRTHLDFHLRLGKDIAFRTMEAALEARELLQDYVELQLFPMCPYDELSGESLDAAEELLRLGMDGLGGAPHLGPEPEPAIKKLFALAVKHGKFVDLHADESDDPARRTVVTIAQETLRHEYQGRVVAGHLCSLSAMPPEEAAGIIALMAEARIGAVTLPAANMYLQGREDTGPFRRGVTRVKELLGASVPLATASDNVQDPFHPFGRADMLQIGLLTAYAAQLGSPAELRQLLRMMTETPAANMGLIGYGVAEGRPATFVITDASSIHELFVGQSPSRWVGVKGRFVHATASRTWSAGGIDHIRNTFDIIKKLKRDCGGDIR